MSTPIATSWSALENPQEFIARHIGLSPQDEAHMLSTIGEASRESLLAGIVPATIRRSAPMDLPPAIGEAAALAAGKQQHQAATAPGKVKAKLFDC